MSEKKKGRNTSPEMLISLAESAKAVNLYAGLIPGPQQMFAGNLADEEERPAKKSHKS